jgi:hypothetical protein
LQARRKDRTRRHKVTQFAYDDADLRDTLPSKKTS